MQTTSAISSIRSVAGDLDKRVRELARERPIVAVIGAALLGLLTARLLSRRRA